MIIVDTPGLHKPHDALGEELNTSALKALEDVDVIAMLIDASKPVGRGDEWVAAQLDGPHCKHAKKICVLSKGDLVTTEQMHEQAEAAKKLANWDAMVGLPPNPATTWTPSSKRCSASCPRVRRGSRRIWKPISD